MNPNTHRIVSALAMATATWTSPSQPEERAPKVLGAAVGGYDFGTLPDLIEPAAHPHHRQFFHSVLFAAALGYGLYRLYESEPTEPFDKCLRAVGLIAGGAYLVHLALDATTSRSLPLVGRIG